MKKTGLGAIALSAVIGFSALSQWMIDPAYAYTQQLKNNGQGIAVRAEKNEQKSFHGWTAYVMNIRATKDVNSTKLGLLDVGSEIKGIDEGEWIRFSYKGQDAYLKREYLSQEIIETGKPVAVEEKVAEQAEKTQVSKFLLKETLNVRKLPTTESEKVGLLYQGHKMNGILVGNWVEIQFEGKTAYITAQFVEELKPGQVDENGNEQAVKGVRQDAFVGWTTDILRVRALPSVDSDVLGTLPTGFKVEGSVQEDWVEFDYEGKRAYVHKNYLSTEEVKEKQSPEIANNVQGMVNLAKSKVGSPYVFASSGPDSFDCSGFVAYLYREVMGINLPRNSEAQWNSGYEKIGLDNLQPGDILYYPGHVAFYIGNGQYIHASTYGVGVVYGNMSDPYSGSFVGAIRVL